MKTNSNYLKLIALCVVITGLYAFSNHRNEAKTVNEVNVEFVGNQNLYITQAMVNKLLIQNYGSLKNVSKDELALNTIEKIVEENEMVKSAQVYLTVNGELTTKIMQRRPIARIHGHSKFYLDDEGKRMPFSKSHSARVPIVTGTVTDKSLEDVYNILTYVNHDDFLHKNVIGIHVESENKYKLRFRMEHFAVDIGEVRNLDKKFNNFKAFYTKATKDKTLRNYSMVNLEFNNQVVCTKK